MISLERIFKRELITCNGCHGMWQNFFEYQLKTTDWPKMVLLFLNSEMQCKRKSIICCPVLNLLWKKETEWKKIWTQRWTEHISCSPIIAEHSRTPTDSEKHQPTKSQIWKQKCNERFGINGKFVWFIVNHYLIWDVFDPVLSSMFCENRLVLPLLYFTFRFRLHFFHFEFTLHQF